MAENLGTVEIKFVESGGKSSSGGEDDALVELKNINGNLSKLISGSLTGLLGGIGGALTSAGSALAVGTAAAAVTEAAQIAENKANLLKEITDAQKNGDVRSGNLDMDKIQELATSGNVDKLAEYLGSSHEYAAKLAKNVSDANLLLLPFGALIKKGKDEVDKLASAWTTATDQLKMYHDELDRRNSSGTTTRQTTNTNIPTTLSDGSPNPFAFTPNTSLTTGETAQTIGDTSYVAPTTQDKAISLANSILTTNIISNLSRSPSTIISNTGSSSTTISKTG